MIGPVSVVHLLLVHESFISGFASVAALLWIHKTFSWHILPECTGYLFKTPKVFSDIHTPPKVQPCFRSIFFFSFPKETRSSPDLRNGSSIDRRAGNRVGTTIQVEERFYVHVILERSDMEQRSESKNLTNTSHSAGKGSQEVSQLFFLPGLQSMVVGIFCK